MWSHEGDFPFSLNQYPRGGVAPLRADVALHDYLQRRAERSAAERRIGLPPVTEFAREVVRAAVRHSLAGLALGGRFRRLLTALAALAAASLLAISSVEAEEMQKLHVIEHAGGEVVTDLGAEGDSAGDLLTFENEIYDEADAERVGSIHGWCIRVVVGKSWECVWTLFHDDGQITVEGPFFDAGDSTLAVTGGTGKFAGVRGEMLLHARNADGSAYDLEYTLRY
jgi:hypothetical protein